MSFDYEQALAREVLLLAYASCYRGLTEIQTVRAAVVRPGLQEVCRITLLAASKEQFNVNDKSLQSLQKQIWRHAAGCALASHWLTRSCNYTELDVAELDIMLEDTKTHGT